MKQRIDEFLAYLLSERRLSPNTVSAYRNDLTQFAEHFDTEAARQGDGAIALATINRERLGGYFLSLRDRGYSSASIARKMAAVRSFFQYLRRNGEVSSDPTEGIGSPEVKKPVPRTASDDDVQALLTYCQNRDTPEGTRDHSMLRLLCATGMRVGELVMLDVADVDVAAGQRAGRRSRQSRAHPAARPADRRQPQRPISSARDPTWRGTRPARPRWFSTSVANA